MLSRTLVVDNQCQPLQVLPWQRALCLTLTERATALVHYDEAVHTVSRSFAVPSVVQMIQAMPSGQHYARFTRANVLTRDKNTCQYCHERKRAVELTLDHVLPRSQGGKTSWTNIASACGPCNRRKGNKTPEEAGMVLRQKPYRPKWSAIVGMRGFACPDPHPTWAAFLRLS